jgi:hypothetical protein
VEEKIFISPLPNKWHKIYQELLKYWEQNLVDQSCKPPIALVLSGWTFTNDFDKKQRWDETIKWAETNGCLHLLNDVNESEKYYVKEQSEWRPYQYSNRNQKSRVRPSIEDCSNYFQKLKTAWDNILGNEFGDKTVPLGFSGKKLRRLTVAYSPGYLPPWGDWNNYLENGIPSSFTTLRKNVNAIIHPHEVDHIDFFPQYKKLRKLKQ